MASIEVMSFGYGHSDGVPEAHLIVDMREHFRDPHRDPRMRELTGRDRVVQRKVLSTLGVRPLLRATTRQVQALAAGPSGGAVRVAFGCVGGRHRSAVAAAVLAKLLRRRGHLVRLIHRDIDKPVIKR